MSNSDLKIPQDTPIYESPTMKVYRNKLLERLVPELEKDAVPGTFEEMLDLLHGDLWNRLLEDCREIMIERQKKYGPDNIPEFGIYGTMVRMNDKFARVKNLIIKNQGKDVQDESLEDTLMDIANYANIMRSQLKGWWTVDHCPRLEDND